MGEREMFCREIRQSRQTQSGCAVRKEHCQSPSGTRTKAARPIGCKARQVRLTHAGVGSPVVATPTGRKLTTSGYPPKKRNMKSSTMKGAQALASEPQQRWSRIGKDLVKTDRERLLYSCSRNRCVVAHRKLWRGGSLAHT